jgi:hypothetical protein
MTDKRRKKMAQKRYDFAKKIKGEGDNEILYARGILTTDVPGLVKTKTGKYVTPTLRVDEEGNLQNYFYKDDEPLPLYSFAGDGKEKELVQPKMVGKTKEKKILLWVNENGKDSFFALEAWEKQAKRLNMFYKKGQEVVIFAHKTVSKGAVSGAREVFWCIDDISKVEKDFIYKKEKPVETTPAGFAEVTNTSDLPFGD